MTEKSAVTASTSEIAALLKVTPRRVRQLAAAGWFSSIERDSWPLVNAAQGYFAFLQKGGDEAPRNSAVQSARAAEIEGRLVRQGEGLIALPEALATVDDIAATLLTALRELPGEIARGDGRERDRIHGVIAPTIRRLEAAFAKSRARLATGREDADEGDHS